MSNWVERIQRKASNVSLRLRPPIDVQLIEQFEAQAGIRLPGDYRAYLLRVGNGGIEPCRLCSLDRWGDCYWVDSPALECVSAPCLITPESDSHGEHWIERLNVPNWEKRWDRGEWSPLQGTIAIAEIGCGLFYSMVMSGNFRGHIFSWGDSAGIPPHFCTEHNFGIWLEARLDAMLAGKPVHFLDGRIR